MKEREKKCQERKKQFRVYFFCWSFPPKKNKTYIWLIQHTYSLRPGDSVVVFCSHQKKIPPRHCALPPPTEVTPRLSTPLVLLRPPVTRSRSSPMILALVLSSTNEKIQGSNSGYHEDWDLRYPMGVFFRSGLYISASIFANIEQSSFMHVLSLMLSQLTYGVIQS